MVVNEKFLNETFRDFWSCFSSSGASSCYQSEFFKYLQADMRKPEAKTIQEHFEKNFSFYSFEDDFYRKIIDDLFDNVVGTHKTSLAR